MISFCMFGAQGGQFSPDKRVYITVFGSCELKRPTIARRVVEGKDHDSTRDKPRTQYFVTIFGTTELKTPTLAEEYIDLQDALRSGMITMDDWDRAVTRFGGLDRWRSASFTLFGSFGGDELPSEEEELDALALNRHLGHIPDEAGKLLILAMGQSGSQRPAAVRQALATAAATPAAPAA